MSGEQKKEVHPIINFALEIARVGFEPVEFDDYAIEQLEDALAECFGKPELINAVTDLINLAAILEKQGSPSASMKLILVATTATEALQKLNESRKLE